MTPDSWLWLLAGSVITSAYVYLVTRVNPAARISKHYIKLVLAEMVIFLILTSGLVMGITGMWWLFRYFAVVYLLAGGPVIVAVLVIAARQGDEDVAEVKRITRDTARDVRATSTRGSDGEDSFSAN